VGILNVNLMAAIDCGYFRAAVLGERTVICQTHIFGASQVWIKASASCLERDALGEHGLFLPVVSADLRFLDMGFFLVLFEPQGRAV
jgi:hypothetical protein